MLSHCSQLVYIPQYSSGTASLNVASAAAIVLHQFACWAKFPPAEIKGQKYIVDETQQLNQGHWSVTKAIKTKENQSPNSQITTETTQTEGNTETTRS